MRNRRSLLVSWSFEKKMVNSHSMSRVFSKPDHSSCVNSKQKSDIPIYAYSYPQILCIAYVSFVFSVNPEGA